MPVLQNLRLKNIGMTKEGLTYLRRFRSIFLKSLDISCNNLSIDDLLTLDVSGFIYLEEIFIFPSLTDHEWETFNRYLNVANSRKIAIRTTIDYVVE